MVELKISDAQIKSTVENLLSLCSIPVSDSGNILVCDEKVISEVNLQAKSGIIVICHSNVQCESSVSSLPHICIKYPFLYSEFIDSVQRLSSLKKENPTLHPQSALILSPAKCTASYGGTTISLSPREMALLISLNRRVGSAVSRETLREEVWGNETEDGTNIVDVYISYLRKKLSPLLGDGSIISKRNLGYMLILPRE